MCSGAVVNARGAVPVGPLKALQGLTPGIETRVRRDDDRG